MSIFVTNGPDIPDHLLQAHEDGRVVFFCGAGISMPAGLPSFKGLVKKIYEELKQTPIGIEKQSMENKQYDVALGQLECRYPGGRDEVRKTLTKILQPKLRRKSATTMHQALLTLSTDREGKTRLVTTNYDQIFAKVIKRECSGIASFSAPSLPIPKLSRWNGVVYLHGLLPNSTEETELNRLVLSSGDFGLAYLTERWAARFVSSLLQDYIVLFVGYGINDPVLRYMMDALAADELLGESHPEAYAFASFDDGAKEKTQIEWEAKGVKPILYEVLSATKDHHALQRTLEVWGNIYRDGVQGKKMIIAQYASKPPLASAQADLAVGQVLWALTNEQAAEHFAKLVPVPPLGWLGPLSEDRFGHNDLRSFGIAPNSDQDKRLKFSFLHRPAPYTKSPFMDVAVWGGLTSSWDEVMHCLGIWLTRHIGDPALILWLAGTRGRLHERFASMVRLRIEKIEELERKGKQNELDSIKASAPRAIPSDPMRRVWRVVLAGRLKQQRPSFYFYDWANRVKQGKFTPSLRMEIRDTLAPCIIFRPPLRLEKDAPSLSESTRVKNFIDWDLVLATDDMRSHLDRFFNNNPEWQRVLPYLLQDFNILLLDALGIMHELGEASAEIDISYISQPSISDHSQNLDSRDDWTILIDLVRDAWLAMKKTDPTQARTVAEGWMRTDYPLFKRLAFFAATHSEVVTHEQALDWLLYENHKWMWSGHVQREVMRLIATLASKLNASQMARLENAILKGPLRTMFSQDVDPEKWKNISDRMVWLMLSKIKSNGGYLGQSSRSKLDDLGHRHPKWRLSEDERDEFPVWIELGTGWYMEWLKSSPAPRRRRGLVKWLKQQQEHDLLVEEVWTQRCNDDFSTVACALCELALENIWIIYSWRIALQVWSVGKHTNRSWRFIGPLLMRAPDKFIRSIGNEIGWWLENITKTFEYRKELFFDLCRRILDLNRQGRGDSDVIDTDSSLERAMNHPVGHVILALLDFWYQEKLKDGQNLPEYLETIFTKVCDTTIETFRYGRTVLARHVIALYRVDRDWTKEHLLPLFDWQPPNIEARSAWEGFMWSPRLYLPLLDDIKKALLETAENHECLDVIAYKRYADFLTLVALNAGDIFCTHELANATRHLSEEGLLEIVWTIDRILDGAGDQRSEYWKNRLQPYFRTIWPQDVKLITPTLSDKLAHMCIKAEDAFPDALKELKNWLQPGENWDSLTYAMHDLKICQKFPKESLEFLDKTVDDSIHHLVQGLKGCLSDIKQADPALANDNRYVRLNSL